MTKQFQTSKGQFIAAEVPEDAENIIIRNAKWADLVPIEFDNRFKPGKSETHALIPAKRKQIDLLFFSASATEEDANKVVDWENIDGYRNYGSEYEFYKTYFKALSSLHSLLTSLGLDVTKNYAILKVNE